MKEVPINKQITMACPSCHAEVKATHKLIAVRQDNYTIRAKFFCSCMSKLKEKRDNS